MGDPVVDLPPRARRALASHVPKAQLMVRGDNPGAVGFWTRVGYERSDVVVLGRRLDGG